MRIIEGQPEICTGHRDRSLPGLAPSTRSGLWDLPINRESSRTVLTMKSIEFMNLPYWPRRMQVRFAAAYIGISPSKFLRDVIAGRLPRPFKDGGNRLWYREDLDAVLDREKVGAASSEGTSWDD